MNTGTLEPMNLEHTMKSWTGRTDGDGPEHVRWHNVVQPAQLDASIDSPGISLIGFASDEGVRRNSGRQGAAKAPDLIRTALAGQAVHFDTPVRETGTVAYEGRDLESGQAALADAVRKRVAAGDTAIVLGGGHETAYATGHGLREASGGKNIAIINLDAHFDLRTADEPTSGTPFLQLANEAEEAGEEFDYSVLGISHPGNTRVLFDEAERLGVGYWTDTEMAAMSIAEVADLATKLTDDADIVHLSIDLDVLPAGTAPGVSAPAALGVDFPRILAAATAIAATGKLALVDMVEFNPEYDIDSRTAKVAARLINDIVCALPA